MVVILSAMSRFRQGAAKGGDTSDIRSPHASPDQTTMLLKRVSRQDRQLRVFGRKLKLGRFPGFDEDAGIDTTNSRGMEAPDSWQSQLGTFASSIAHAGT